MGPDRSKEGENRSGVFRHSMIRPGGEMELGKSIGFPILLSNVLK